MFGTSKKELWCCKATLAPGKSRDDVYTVCKAAKVDARDVIGAFAGLLTESRFQLLIKDPASENYFTARDLAEEIAKKKKIKDYTFQENVLGSKKDMEKGCAAAGQAIFAHCPGLDAVLTLEVKRDTPEGEQRRQDMFAVGDIITQKVHEGQQRQTKKIENKVAAATKEAKDHNEFVTVKQTEVLADEVKKNNEQNMAHQDRKTAMVMEAVNEAFINNNALVDENRALRLELQAAYEQNRALQQALPGSALPELEQSESGQLALQNEHQVEPPSAGSDTLGVTPRTNSVEIRRALGREFSLLRGDRPSPESPEAYDDDDDDDAIVEEAPLQGAVAAAALDHETVDEAPLQEATALSPVDAPPPADIASPAPAPAAEDDKGGVKALSTPARPTLERQIASVSRQFWEKHEEGKLRKIKDRTNKPSPLPQPSPPAEEG